MSAVGSALSYVFDPLADRVGFDVWSWLSLGLMCVVVVMLIAYEVMRSIDPQRLRLPMRLLGGMLVPLCVLSVALIAYRFERLA
jgi:hypothetical protein